MGRGRVSARATPRSPVSRRESTACRSLGGSTMPSEYRLEVYRPRSARDACVVFDSKQPFMAIVPGETLNPALWPGSDFPPEHVLRVVHIQHIIGSATSKSPLKHTIMVFTEEIENKPENVRFWS